MKIRHPMTLHHPVILTSDDTHANTHPRHCPLSTRAHHVCIFFEILIFVCKIKNMLIFTYFTALSPHVLITYVFLLQTSVYLFFLNTHFCIKDNTHANSHQPYCSLSTRAHHVCIFFTYIYVFFWENIHCCM